jgi:hypothetical protein
MAWFIQSRWEVDPPRPMRHVKKKWRSSEEQKKETEREMAGDKIKEP